MLSPNVDPRAPMASAPFKYEADGRVDWGNMWDSYCVLATQGGPPHRSDLLRANPQEDISAAGYQTALAEITRGIAAVSGLAAHPGPAGWIQVATPSRGFAAWLVTAIIAENVEARRDGRCLLLPVAGHFTTKGEIKNVITAVAKTTHYWQEHVPAEARSAAEIQARLQDMLGGFSHFRARLTRQAMNPVTPPVHLEDPTRST